MRSQGGKKTVPSHWIMFVHLMCLFLLVSSGCASLSPLRPTDVRIVEYHVEKCFDNIETFITRLYAKNPKYEPEDGARHRKLATMFAGEKPTGPLSFRSSRELLTAAFAQQPMDPDRVYLLGLGLVKSVREAYGLDERKVFVSTLQVDLGRLERFHHNLSQVNWRLKTYKDREGSLLFQANAIGDDGYFNMGYEVLMTEMLTWVQDDIYLRGGAPEKHLFNMSTMFLSIVL